MAPKPHYTSRPFSHYEGEWVYQILRDGEVYSESGSRADGQDTNDPHDHGLAYTETTAASAGRAEADRLNALEG